MVLGQGLGQFVNCFMSKPDDLGSICSTSRKVNSNRDSCGIINNPGTEAGGRERQILEVHLLPMLAYLAIFRSRDIPCLIK